MTTQARHTDYLPLDEVAEDPKNPKSHDLSLMNDSVGRFGFIEPMVMDERTGYLVSGHGRRMTLEKMRDRGDNPPDGVDVDEAGTWLVPVVRGWSSSSDAEAHAALAALNRIGEKGGWEDGELLAILEEVNALDEGLLGVGFTDSDLTVLRRLAEAEAVYSIGVEHMMDEFRDVSGQDPPDYRAEYAAKVTVYIRDAEAIQDFKDRLGLEDVTKAVNYPPGWTPNDRRRYKD